MLLVLAAIKSIFAVVPLVELAYAGDRVGIKCTTSSSPFWTHNGQPLENPETIGSYLILWNVQESNSGIYACNIYVPPLVLLVGGK